MLIYILTFSLSLFNVYMANRHYKKKGLFYFFSFFAVAPLVLLASFRASNVGSDTSFYQIPFWRDALLSHGGLIDYIERHPNFEAGYLFVNYFISLLTDNIVYLFLVIYTLIILPVYKVAMRWRKSLSPFLFMTIYCLVCYNELLSTVRQGIAMSLSLLAFNYFLEQKYYKYFSLSVMAYAFHTSVLIPFVFPFVYKFVDKYKLEDCRLIYMSFSALFICILLNFDNILVFVINNNFLAEKFIEYTSKGNAFEGDLGLSNLIVKLMILAYIYFIMKLRGKSTFVDFFFLMAILDLAFSSLGIIINHLIRLSLYPRMMTCISLPFLFKNYPLYIRLGKIRYKLPFEFIFISLLLFYWYYVYIYGDFAATSDYKFNPEIF